MIATEKTATKIALKAIAAMVRLMEHLCQGKCIEETHLLKIKGTLQSYAMKLHGPFNRKDKVK